MVTPNSRVRTDLRRQRQKPFLDRCVLWSGLLLGLVGLINWLFIGIDWNNYNDYYEYYSTTSDTSMQKDTASDNTADTSSKSTSSTATAEVYVNSKAPKHLMFPTRLQELIDDLRGDDHRLVRWDATKHTRKKQRGGSCDNLPRVVQILTDDHASEAHKAMACEFLTFCLTDNPRMRVIFEKTKTKTKYLVYKAIVDLVKSTENPHASAMAGHLIYSASFANKKNHQGFIKANAVQHLGAIVKDHVMAGRGSKNDRQTTKVQVMWAAAALQNLAASYCETEDNGRCFWKWNKQNFEEPELKIRSSSQPLLSDGQKARQEILNDEELLRALLHLVCQGPVKGRKSSQNPYPGHNAIARRDDNSPNIVPWAATGVIKNVALESSREFLGLLDSYMPCFCKMKRYSDDWLEENKASAVLEHTRRKNPCWFEGDGEDSEDDDDESGTDVNTVVYSKKQLTCVDRYFVDQEGFDCSGYEEASPKECSVSDAAETTTAKLACCPCGGGTREGAKGKSNTRVQAK